MLSLDSVTSPAILCGENKKYTTSPLAVQLQLIPVIITYKYIVL